MKILFWIARKVTLLGLIAVLIGGIYSVVASGHYMAGWNLLGNIGGIAFVFASWAATATLLLHFMCYFEDNTSLLSKLKLKHVKIASFGIIIVSILFGTIIWYGNERNNRTYAKFETFVTSKEMGIFCSNKNCPDKLKWSYSYETRVDGKECGYLDPKVKVNYVVHECPSGYEEVSEAQWRELKVGDVLKVVELK